MIKRIVTICLLTVAFTALKAQTYSNEWINYSQKYYKIKVASNGIYRIDYAKLIAAGIPVNTIDPHNFQLFNKGLEQAIYIEGENDNVFNETDFIEFYGEKNDGRLDSLLYVNSAFVPNPYYSLINDTAVYFLTWNNSTANKRFQSETDTTFSSFSPDSYFFKNEIQAFSNAYYNGETDAVGGTDFRYTRAEGWFDANVINLGGTASYNINTTNKFNGGPNSTITTVVLGASKDAGLIKINRNDHHLKIEYNNNSLVDTLFKGYAAHKFIYNIPTNNLGASSTELKYTSIADGEFTSNRTVVSYIHIRYPHTFDLENKNEFYLYIPQNTTQAKSFLNITNFNSTGTVWLYDITNGKRIKVIKNGPSLKALVPNTGSEKKCYLASEINFNKVALVDPITPSAQFTNYTALSTNLAYIIITHKSLMSAVNNYKTYRSTNIYGGQHNVIVADIDELYDQFAYGIVKSPLAIRRFCDYLLNTYPTPPLNLFLIGKSIHVSDTRKNTTNYANNLVPSFGNPSSDNLLTAGLKGTSIEPAIPTGRLAARTVNDVNIYLNKIQQYENTVSNPPAEWKKQFLHFGGGNTASEQVAFKNYLNFYKKIIEDTLYGGRVNNFFKTNSSPIQINTSDTLRNFMNNGVSFMTFFGHASSSGFDQSIDDINLYSPLPGHYPFMLANGCYSGDIHTSSNATSETYVINNNKGMIGYLASVGLGVPYALNYFSTELYQQLSISNYGKSIGSTIKKTITNIKSFALTDSLIRATCYEMTLHGDPAIVINSPTKPDYTISTNDVSVDLKSQIDSFTVYATITNLGKAINDSIFVETYRTFPDGTTKNYLTRALAPKFKDTIAIKIPFDFSKDLGLNKIKITLDFYNTVNELNETNNSTNPNITFVISSGDLVPVYPYEFAIVPNSSVTLKASTANAFAKNQNYVFQIDTTDMFNSPLLQSTKINSSGGIVTWQPPSTFIAGKVYYWRVSPDSTSVSNTYKWRVSSFQYIPSQTGWGQSHFFQFENNTYEYVKFNRPQRKFNFVNDIKSLQCMNGITPYINWVDVGYKINGTAKYVWTWTVPGLTIAVFDSASANNWISVSQGNGFTQYGSITGTANGVTDNAFDFYQNDSTNRAAITNFINNKIPNGFNVLLYTQSYHSVPSYENSLYTAIESLGSSKIRTVPAARPYILFGKKGSAPGSAREMIGDSVNSILKLDTTLTSNWNQGAIFSPTIGPATHWDSLSWKQHTIDGATTDDSIAVQLIGIDTSGNEITLANFNSNTLTVSNLANYVDAKIYPTIRLVAYMKDNTLHTPPQLDSWQVIYTPVPEAAIDPSSGYSFTKDSLQQGEQAMIHLPIKNISDYSFNDSLLITYWIEDANRVNHPLPNRLKKNGFAPNEVIIDTIRLNSEAYQGDNALWVEVNPINKPKSQLEKYHFNNIARIPFYVRTDNTNPLLDVTFDGVHILNNDIVSATPNILIQLKDENQFLALNDTNDFKIFLQTPASNIAQRIYFGNAMIFLPASLPNNSCKINYTPSLTEDGQYQLIVQAKDKSNNQSGRVDYRINFEVVTKSTITEVLNYPNPFSTATRFVFTLTGSQLPTYFKIQILTITGKVVREINLDELGPIHIGRNITDYAWDGKDEFGDQLANGVYLYRIVTNINNEHIEKRESEADQYFKKGFGKMYLLR